MLQKLDWYFAILCLGWLESLISRIAEDRTRVVCPVIDIISDDTFAYVRSFELHWGAFNWELHFRWYTLGGGEIKKRKEDVTEPFRYSLADVLGKFLTFLVQSGLYFGCI
jgi:hypothetical protein